MSKMNPASGAPMIPPQAQLVIPIPRALGSWAIPNTSAWTTGNIAPKVPPW